MTFLEGLLSFLSPCVLPMVPVYLIYMSAEKRSPLPNALGFVLGFSSVFILLGVCAGSVGAALAAHRRLLDVVCALAIAFFGISFIFNLPLPFKGMGGGAMRPTRFFKSFVFGMVYSVCLTPCVGAFLGAALMTAASEGGAAKGALLLAEYSAGLAIPFVLSALAIDKLKNLFGFFKTHARGVSVFSGVLLIVFAGWTMIRRDVSASAEPGSDAGEVEEAAEVVLTDANFEAEVIKSDRPVLVDFWAPWCGPCQKLAPEIEKLAREKVDVLKVGKVDIDANPGLREKYGITSIPALLVFRKGDVSARAVGFRDRAGLLELLGFQEPTP